eukprot:2588449-Pyramimonas_sp.AAC.1
MGCFSPFRTGHHVTLCHIALAWALSGNEIFGATSLPTLDAFASLRFNEHCKRLALMLSDALRPCRV